MTALEPVHRGEILKHDFMEPLELSATSLARAIGVTPARVNEIVRRRRGAASSAAESPESRPVLEGPSRRR